MDANESLEKSRIVVMLDNPRANAIGIPVSRQRRRMKKSAAVVILGFLP